MSRKALMAAAAVIVVGGGVAVVAIGPGHFFPSPHPMTTNTEHLSSISGSGATPTTPVSAAAPVARLAPSNQAAAVPGQQEQLRSRLPLSATDAVRATARIKSEQLGASVS